MYSIGSVLINSHYASIFVYIDRNHATLAPSSTPTFAVHRLDNERSSCCRRRRRRYIYVCWISAEQITSEMTTNLCGSRISNSLFALCRLRADETRSVIRVGSFVGPCSSERRAKTECTREHERDAVGSRNESDEESRVRERTRERDR